MPLDASARAFLEQLRAAGTPPLSAMTPAQARALAPPPVTEGRPEMHAVEDVSMSTGVSATPFRVRVLKPSPSPRGIIVYHHGGGWVLSDIEQFDRLGRELAQATGAAVVMVDYRKAPEHPYPAAVEDSWTALSWVWENAARISASPAPFVVAGDSSGGNLATVMARRARDRGGPPIDLQILVYPCVDSDLDTESHHDPAYQLLLTRESSVWFWDHYLPDRTRRAEADAAPGRVADLSGLPPTVMALAEFDILRAEGRRYADRLRAAGVPVLSRTFDGQMHGFFNMLDVMPAARQAVRFVSDAMNFPLDHLRVPRNEAP